ncbi:diaminopropionate ammonia-lyase [Rubrobacter aplysinae]|uniref:diaminopropionate ammonia-lyase n=1 Tax=Rubrobacter aplysinae TaxID=909625 RepID=UPI00064C45B7|nr:diaminopropionate ammonia-lyase [Rubrobacter aplysinae]
MSPRILRNAGVSAEAGSLAPDRRPLELHRRLPSYAPTPLVDAPALADALGVGRVWVKDESGRLGLPAFKILGASWAAYRALEERAGGDLGEWRDVAELRDRVSFLRPLTLSTATDGNHGRAVARVAALLGLDARVFVPAGMAPARVEAIEHEGAEVVAVDGTYDETVARCAREADERCVVIQDTSWPGYEEVPWWVIEGYSTILWEVEDELARREEPGPDLAAAQIGVGAFAAAVCRHYRRPGVSPRPALVGVEPESADCALRSVEAGRLVSVPGPHPSIMAGLNCGLPSGVAWPLVSGSVDLFAAIRDEPVRRAMRLLAGSGIVSGETGAAGLAGLLELADAGELPADEESRLLIFNCEGATDPEAYDRILAGAS